MELTRVQRWLLVNQLRILAVLNPDEATMHSKHADALAQGFSGEYSEICSAYISPDAETLDEDACREVLDVLSMFEAVQHAYADHANGDAIHATVPTFRGFDGNHEGPQLAYVRYLWHDFRFVNTQAVAADPGNSHRPMLPHYRRMLTAWRLSADPYALTVADLIRLSAAGQSSEAL